MPVLGALVHLRASPAERAAALLRLAALPGLSLGDAVGGAVPVALESADRDEDRARWDALCDHPDVLHVALVFADFSDLPDTTRAGASPAVPGGAP